MDMSVEHIFTDSSLYEIQQNKFLLPVQFMNMSVEHIFTDSSLYEHVSRTHFYWQFTLRTCQ